MRNIFFQHYIYTVAVGLLVFWWAFSQPPLATGHLVSKAESTPKSSRQAGAQSGRVEAVKPIGGSTIVKKSAPTAAPSGGQVADEIVTSSINGLTEPQTEAGRAMFLVEVDNLRMRTGPSSNAGTIAAYPRGTRLEKISLNGNWMEVRNPEHGTIGWMFTGYLRPVR